MTLSGAEIDTLYRLARAHPLPVDAGDIPSKVGRSGLLEKGLAEVVDNYRNGQTICTRNGLIEYHSRRKLDGAIS